MTEVSTTLCRLGPSAVAVAHGTTLDSVIITIQGDGALHYCISRKENLAAWSVSAASHTFTSAVVFNTASKLFHAAITTERSSCHQVWSWKADAPAGPLDRVATRCNLPKAVHSIHPTTCSPRLSQGIEAEEHSNSQPEASTSGREEHGGVFVVFLDGSIALESFYSNGKLGQCLGQEAAVEAVSCYQGILAVLVTEEEQKHVLRLYTVEEGQLHLLKAKQLQLPEGVSVSALSLRGQALSVLCSDGSLQSYSFFPQPGHTFSLHLQNSRRLAGYETSLQPRTPQIKNGKKNAEKSNNKRKSEVLGNSTPEHERVVITASGSLVASAIWTNEEGSNRKRLRMNVLEGTYGTVCRTSDIYSAEQATFAKCTSLQALYLGEDAKQVALLAAGSLLLVPIEDQPPKLASLVGSLSLEGGSSVQAVAARAAFHVDERPKLRPPPGLHTLARPCWVPKPEAVDALPSEALLELAVPLDMRDDSQASHEETLGKSEEYHAVMDSVYGSTAYSSQKEADQLAEYLLQEPPHRCSRLKALSHEAHAHVLLSLGQQGHWDVFALLNTSRPLLTFSYAPGLLPLLAKAGQHREIARILSKARDAAPKDFLEALQCLLDKQGPDAESWQESLKASNPVDREDKQQDLKLVREAEDSAALTERFSPQETTLHAFVASKMDSSALLLVLRQLGSQRITLLIQYLLSWLRLLSMHYVSIAGKELAGGGCLPSLKQITQWTTVLIDSHLVALASKPESRQVAANLQTLVLEHLRGLAGLRDLKGMVEQVQKGEPLPSESANDASYVVELLDLSIH